MKCKSNAFFRRSLKVIRFKKTDKIFQTVPIQVLYLIVHGLTSFVHTLNGALPCNGTLGAKMVITTQAETTLSSRISP